MGENWFSCSAMTRPNHDGGSPTRFMSAKERKPKPFRTSCDQIFISSDRCDVADSEPSVASVALTILFLRSSKLLGISRFRKGPDCAKTRAGLD
jgi:hypothetical protein